MHTEIIANQTRVGVLLGKFGGYEKYKEAIDELLEQKRPEGKSPRAKIQKIYLSRTRNVKIYIYIILSLKIIQVSRVYPSIR